MLKKWLQLLSASVISLFLLVILTSQGFASLDGHLKLYVWLTFIASLLLNFSFRSDRRDLLEKSEKGQYYMQVFFAVICLAFSFYGFYRAFAQGSLVSLIAAVCLLVLTILLAWGLKYIKKP